MKTRSLRRSQVVSDFVIPMVVVGAFLAIAFFVITGCGSPAPGTGYVRNKQFDAGHMEGAWKQRYAGENCVTRFNPANKRTEQSCTSKYDTYYEPNDHWVPDRWQMLLENCYSQDGCRTDWVTVSETTFAKYANGDHYPNPR